MGKTKRKYRKNKRTRKRKGGVIDDIELPKDELCLKNIDITNRKWNSHRAWILHLIKALPKGKKRIENITENVRLKEREKWCGNKEKENKGYCNPEEGTAWVKKYKEIEHRCKKDGKGANEGYCLIDLDLSEWYHCTDTCGRVKPKDQEKFIKIKQNEFRVNCNDVKVKIGKDEVSLVDAPRALEILEKKIEKEKKEAEKKAKKEEEERKKKLREQEVQAKMKLAKEKKKKEEEHAKEVAKRRKEKEKENKEKRKEKCSKDLREKKEKKQHELEIINTSIDGVQTLEQIEDIQKELAEINPWSRNLSKHFENNNCIYEFDSMRNDIKAVIKDLTGDKKILMKTWEKLFKKQEQIVKMEEENVKKKEVNNKKTNKYPPMKITRFNSDLPSCPGRICRGSIITGQPDDAWTSYEYEGYVLGPKGRKGWPVVYNYNNKYPWFGMFVKERQATTTNEKRFKNWFNKYLTNHETEGKNNGRSNALRSMRDKHDINIPQKLVEYFPRKFGEGKPDWKGGKRKTKRKRKTNKKKFRKKGTKKNR